LLTCAKASTTEILLRTEVVLDDCRSLRASRRVDHSGQYLRRPVSEAQVHLQLVLLSGCLATKVMLSILMTLSLANQLEFLGTAKKGIATWTVVCPQTEFRGCIPCTHTVTYFEDILVSFTTLFKLE
jgi:hypothetical protein